MRTCKVLFRKKVYKCEHVFDTRVHTSACCHGDTCCQTSSYKAKAFSKLVGSRHQSLYSSILHAILFQAWPVVTSYPSDGTCCVTCQERSHRYFGGWKGTVVSTPCNPGTKSETEMSTNNASEPYVKPSKFASRHELRFLFVYLANQETMISSIVHANKQSNRSSR